MIYRSKRAENFTVLGNGIFADNGLSFEAMGLLAYLLSKPDNWAVHVQALVKATEGTAQQRGKNKIHALLNELIDAGYITRKRQSSGEMNYYVFDEPQTVENKPQPSNPAQANPAQANPAQANPAQDFEAVLINTEGQQELNLKKNGQGAKARAAHATPPADAPNEQSAPPCPASSTVAEESSAACPAKAKRKKDAVFDDWAELEALGVERKYYDGWMKARRLKKSVVPLTEAAFEGFLREAEKVGLSVPEAVQMCAEKSWAGINSKWECFQRVSQSRTFDHITGAMVGTGNVAVDLAQQQAARAADWLASLPTDAEGNLI